MRIDDDLLMLLRERAHRESVPLTQLINRMIRQGMNDMNSRQSKAGPPYREQVHSMGTPKYDLTRALALASSLDDEETLAELDRRK